MMMTFLLKNILNNDEKYHLDVHGCHPISIKKTASAIQFKHGKWLIECRKDLFPSISKSFPDQVIEKTEDEKITVDFGDSNYGIDYIELGQKLVELLEEIDTISAE
jgi:hypothetical protein